MKRLPFLCMVLSAVLVLGCANQNSDAINGTGAQRGTLYGVSGAGGGGGGPVPNRNAIKNIP